MYGLDFENRQDLYDKINARVDDMLARGLLDEVRCLCEIRGHHGETREPYTSAQAIGHKELLPHLYGEYNLETCTEKLKMNTRNYAKRQLTWFRKNVHINWLYMNENAGYDTILENAINVYEKFKK